VRSGGAPRTALLDVAVRHSIATLKERTIAAAKHVVASLLRDAFELGEG